MAPAPVREYDRDAEIGGVEVVSTARAKGRGCADVRRVVGERLCRAW
ncbi:hypothetical protein SCNU_14691 [Gordonia neofelifaecis NRRL B-59395]|uniref:Uncharacterized protein n=1 Tax=Gordonia neofelifaecis NRRL B-59395 TaxID=644548 RepID=F1YLZ4_9ACTN|nr:hypothetical protein SCNU_14691 [Gordonia neofelifaecis NRRL B-59395]